MKTASQGNASVSQGFALTTLSLATGLLEPIKSPLSSKISDRKCIYTKFFDNDCDGSHKKFTFYRLPSVLRKAFTSLSIWLSFSRRFNFVDSLLTDSNELARISLQIVATYLIHKMNSSHRTWHERLKIFFVRSKIFVILSR